MPNIILEKIMNIELGNVDFDTFIDRMKDKSINFQIPRIRI